MVCCDVVLRAIMWFGDVTGIAILIIVAVVVSCEVLWFVCVVLLTIGLWMCGLCCAMCDVWLAQCDGCCVLCGVCAVCVVH